MASRSRYFFTSLAAKDLDEIISYITTTLCNPVAASSFVEDLEASIDSICRFPDSGTIVDNDLIVTKLIRYKVIGNYLMYYFVRTDDNSIIILRILYGKRDPSEIIGLPDL